MKTVVIAGQSLLDIAVQETGSFMAAIEIAIANGISITDDLTPGDVLIIPRSEYLNIDMVNYFRGRRQRIATISSIEIPPTGIGYMILETDFIVA